MRAILTRVFALLGCAAFLAAQSEDLLWPSIGTPMRDAAVCTGPDGAYYLTGTTAAKPPLDAQASYAHCRGVRVWRSQDLLAWEDLGLVWDLWKHAKISPAGGDVNEQLWQSMLTPVPGLPSGERARGMTAPRLAHDGSRFWITYSMNGYAAGAMPGTADVAGPYQETGVLAEAGGSPTGSSDATLFVDRDGTRYLVWGGGCVAKMKPPEALAKLPQHEVGIDGRTIYVPALSAGFLTDAGMPERGAPYGASLFHDGRDYVFVFTASTLRDGGVHQDSYAMRSKSLAGPYDAPRFLVLDSGRCVPFASTDGAWRISYAVQDRPVIAAFPTSIPQVARSRTPAPACGPIGDRVPPRLPVARPKDVPQLIEFIEPCLDHPLRDASLCRGPDGTWYLTGTEASQADGGTLDWSRNTGIHLWKSPDRNHWTDCGYVWDIERDAPKSPTSAWQLEGHLDLTCGAAPRVGRAMTAPEIHHLKGTFWIVYSMNGSGIGLLKSTSGRAEGPYEDLGRLVPNARDGSLYEDEQGNVSVVWGQGFSVRLTADMTATTGPVSVLFANVVWYPGEMRRPYLMGQWGSQLVRHGDWHIWVFTTRTGRGGINAIDTMASWSKSVAGPWGEPCALNLDGGQSTLVPAGDGTWISTVSGEDEYSQCPFQAAWTPVGTAGEQQLALQPYKGTTAVSQWNAVNSLKETTLDLGFGWPDLIKTEARDVFLDYIDGWYYLTGTLWGANRAYRDTIGLFRSKDMFNWEELPPVYRFEDLKRDGFITDKDMPKFDALVAKMRAGQTATQRGNMGEGKLFMWKGCFYASFLNCGQWSQMPLLKSQSGGIEGPFKPVRPLGGFCDVMIDDDGSFFIMEPKPAFTRFASLDAFIAADPDSVAAARKPITFATYPNLRIWEDCETGLKKVAGRYVTWETDENGNYDASYFYTDRMGEPWKGKFRIIPHGGNGRMFQAADGSWWFAYFRTGNAHSSRKPINNRPNFFKLAVAERQGELVLEPEAMVANRSRIEAMGALWHRSATDP